MAAKSLDGAGLEERWTAVDRFLAETLVQPDSALDAALEATEAAGLPAINVSPSQGKLLMLLALLREARNILEIGTLGGYSAIWMARGLAPGGRLITLEADPRHAEVARANLARAGVGDLVEVRVGRAQESLPGLVQEGAGPFDLIFIDADKPSNPAYLAWALKLARVGTVIVTDNVVRGGAVLDPASDDAAIQGIRSFHQALGAEPRLSATAIQTVGLKGYDGFALALVTAP